ncbi:MAG TPA: DUF2059 domain-containing protein [Bryobacteraceae bacterium]|jgi:hypothetical protein|nr:DUF2059 domain-containing protein [Bryobacteraceae bacterium]
MRVIRLFSIIGLLLVAAAPKLLVADEASKNAKIAEIFQLAKLDQSLKQTLETSANQIKSGFFQQLMGLQLTPEEQRAMENVQNKLQALLAEGLSWSTLEPMYVKLYSDMFSEDEIDGMLTFYRTPAGKAMLEKTPKLIAQANVIVQQRLVAMQPQFTALLKELDGLKGK